MPPRTVTLVAAACLTTGWLLGSLISPPIAELQVLPERTPPRDPRASEPVTTAYTDQLHFKLQQAPLPPTPRRNPFVFGTTPRATLAAPTSRTDAPRDSQSAPEDISVPAAPVAIGPRLALSGIGSTDTPSGAVLTAIISDGQTVHLGKVGEVVAGYSIVEIAEDAVTITNAAGARWVLRLR
jgi:hypothetical protein